MDDDLRPAQPGDAPADAAGGPPDPDGAGDTPQPPQWEERDAWTALDDLDASPALVPASEWPAGAEGLDRPGLFGFWVDEAGAAQLARGLDLPFEAGRIYVGQAGATRWPSGRVNADTLGDRVGRTHLAGKVRGSALRLTLASILLDQLDLMVQAAMLLQASSEQDAQRVDARSPPRRRAPARRPRQPRRPRAGGRPAPRPAAEHRDLPPGDLGAPERHRPAEEDQPGRLTAGAGCGRLHPSDPRPTIDTVTPVPGGHASSTSLEGRA